VLIFHAALPITVRHVVDFHLKNRSMCKSLLYRGIGIFDVQILGSTHGSISFCGFTHHDSRGPQFDLHVLD